MKKRTYAMKIVAMLLSAAILVTEVPLDVLGAGAKESAFTANPEFTAEEAVADEEEVQKPHIVAELDGERSETTKTFRMSDGSYTLVTYDQPVHYETKEGVYEEIDNTMIPDEAATFSMSEEEIYRNRAGAANILFRKTSSETAAKISEADAPQEEPVQEESSQEKAIQESESQKAASEEALEEEAPLHEAAIEVSGELVSWNYEGILEGELTWEPAQDPSELSGDEAFLAVPNAINRGIYEDAFAYTDLQYIISPEGIKENIILKDKKAAHAWKLNLNTGDLQAVQKDDQTIELYGEGEAPVMIIAAPMMMDAEEKINTAVTMELEEKEEGLTLIITADPEFLQSEETVYPVTVDPYFYLVSKKDVAISDTFLSSAMPSTNMRINGVASGSLMVGRESSMYGKTRSLLKMDTLPKLPAGSVITGADLILFNYYSYSAGNGCIWG